METNLLETYADLVSRIKALEDERAALVPQVMTHIQALGEKTIETERGAWSIVDHVTWSYSADVKRAEDSVKSLKKIEQESGTAEAKQKSVLRFQEAK